MRTEKELLLIAKDCLQNRKTEFYHGLCNFFIKMYCAGFITASEKNLLIRTISKYKNMRPRGSRYYDYGYYFEPGEIKPRVKYLNQLIKMHHENFFIRNFWRFFYLKNTI